MWIAAHPELCRGRRIGEAKVLIKGHAFSYAGRKNDASGDLRPDAFFYERECGTRSYMPRKATYIRAWRKERGHSLDEVVGRLAVLGVPMTGASLSRIERGIQPYSQDMLEALADALDVNISQLIEHNPTMPGATIYHFMSNMNLDDAKRAEKVLRAMFGDKT